MYIIYNIYIYTYIRVLIPSSLVIRNILDITFYVSVDVFSFCGSYVGVIAKEDKSKVQKFLLDANRIGLISKFTCMLVCPRTMQLSSVLS